MDCIGLVFDFDGTMCRLFKNYNLNQTVAELHSRMEKYGFYFQLDSDAFDIFDFIGRQEDLNEARKRSLYMEMDGVLVSAEKDAVKSCELVQGVSKVMSFLHKSGFKLGVATNNSPQCVSEFLKLYCGGLDIPIVGRVGCSPELMKPDKWSLIEVLKKMNCSVDDAVFFGDTRRDYECALNAGCKFIGVAPTEKKLCRLEKIRPEIEIVLNFYELKDKLFKTNA